MSIEVQFCLCWRDVSDWAKQAPVVEPIDPSEGGHFQILHIATRSLAMDQFSFVEAIDRFSEGVVRGFDACFG